MRLGFISFICLEIALACLINKPCNSQNFTVFADKTFGGTDNDMDGNLIYVGNDEFIIAGYSHSDVSGDKTEPLCQGMQPQPDLWILKVDKNFNIIWQKGLGGSHSEARVKLTKINNGLIAFGAITSSDSSCDVSQPAYNLTSDYWIGVIDTSGSLLWERRFGGLQSESECHIRQLPSGEFIVVGSSGPGVLGGDKTVSNYGSNDYWVIKTDSMGNKLWDKVYGGTENEPGGTFGEIDMLVNSQGNIVIAGRSHSSISGTITDTSNGSGDMFVFEIDTAGIVLWNKLIGGSSLDACNGIIECNAGGYMLLGSTQSPMDGDIQEPPKGIVDLLFVRLDANGNMMWNKRFGGNASNLGYDVIEDLRGGFIGIGSTNSPVSYDVSEPSYGMLDYWVIKIDSSGNKIWDKRFGAQGDDRGHKLIQLPDTSLILLGRSQYGSSPSKTDPGEGGFDYWLVHMKYNDSTTSITGPGFQHEQITLYPNPVENLLHIEFSTHFEIESIKIIDITGKLVLETVLNFSNTIDVSGLTQGCYIIEILSGYDYRSHQKFFKR